MEQDKTADNSLRIPPPPKHRKGQSHTEVLKVHNVMSYGDTPMCQIWYSCQRAKTTLLKHIFMMIFFYIGTKGKGQIEGMNVCDTSSHGDTLMCQIR